MTAYVMPRPTNGLPSLKPSPHRRPDQVLRIAHRGADAQERYGASDLLRVASQGAHLVEFDLHVTADDELVARHDPVLDYDGVRTWLADRSLEELRPTLERAQIPPVVSLIAAAKAAGLGLYIDIKSATTRAIEQLVELLETESMAGCSILASARSDLVAICAQVAPDLPHAVLFASTLEEPVQLAESVGAQYVHPCWERLPRPDLALAGPWLDRARARGLGVICWHEERPVVLEALCNLGVDGVCTDRPAVLTGIALRH